MNEFPKAITEMRHWLYLINNFAHDLFTGIWFGSFVGIYTARTSTGQFWQLPAAAATVVNGLVHRFFWLGAASLALVMFTGCIRFLYRRQWDALEAPNGLKRPILIVKHALLGTAFLAGSVHAFLWTF
ncbi:MAG: hypothetical protein V1782_09400 [Pseudomonadota bacterium]